jgi:uncharacterized protein (TIGR03086 family)
MLRSARPDPDLAAMSSRHARGLMGMDAVPDLEPAAARVRALLPGVGDDQLMLPTPCDGYAVADLLSHLVGLTVAFRDAAHKQPSDGVPGAVPPLDLAWREVLPAQLDELVAAWREPGAGDGMTAAGGVEMPGAIAAAVALDELVLHGWDLARATGQPYECDPMSAEVVHGFVSAVAAEGDEGREGLFGRPVDVAPSAPLFDRCLGLSGRDPAWQPPGRR